MTPARQSPSNAASHQQRLNTERGRRWVTLQHIPLARSFRKQAQERFLLLLHALLEVIALCFGQQLLPRNEAQVTFVTSAGLPAGSTAYRDDAEPPAPRLDNPSRTCSKVC